jgi:hypothetical protein
MPNNPKFNYFLYSSDNLVLKNSTNWKAPFPLTRNLQEKKSNKKPENLFRIGDYFESVRKFLTNQGLEAILAYTSKVLDKGISKNAIKAFDVYLEKHGEFYHPARVETKIYDKTFSFALNVAISTPGNNLAKKEFNLLQKLNKRHRPSFLPNVICLGEVNQNQNITMFLCEWLEDFHEFHIANDSADGKNKIIVWSPKGNFFLSDKKTAKLYTQTAKILTAYYSIDTFEQILSWHHAAGDFIINTTDNDIDLKLITVRKYASIFKNDGGASDDTGSMLEALLLFLLNISMRMRLDRQDGVGAVIWSGNIAVKSCPLGFYQGLEQKYHEGLQTGFADVFFKDYLARFSRSSLYELCVSILDKFYQNDKEINIVKSNLKEHIQVLHTAILSVTKSL